MRRWLRSGVATMAIGFATLSYTWITLPDVRALRKDPPATTAFREMRAEQAEDEGRTLKMQHRWVNYDRISSHLKRAVIVAEDSAFWQHEGLDFDEIRASMEVNWMRGEFVRGASTITQQLAKNLYLSPSRNPYRKVKELLITRRLEAELSKRRIFELYLNLIEWGDGIWGAEAAARAHFGVSAAALSPAQAAMLAGAIINPRVYSPSRPNARLLRRQNLILRRMGTVTPPDTPAPAAAPTAPTVPTVPIIIR
jgi:monofunctional glycosyltransferase